MQWAWANAAGILPPMSKKLVLKILASALLLTGCSKPAAEHTRTATQTRPQPELAFGQELQDVLDGWLEERDGMGISAAVIVPEHKTWVGVSGVSHGTIPIRRDTLFSAGSIKKMFTAATILQLAEEGLLSLEDPLHRWLVDYPNIDNTITIRQLLNHTSGVYDMVENPEYWKAMFAQRAKYWDPNEVLTGDWDFDGLAGLCVVVIGPSGNRQKPALAAHVPLGRPTGAGESPASVGLLHLRSAHRPAITADAVEMLSFDPHTFVRENLVSRARHGHGCPEQTRREHA